VPFEGKHDTDSCTQAIYQIGKSTATVETNIPVAKGTVALAKDVAQSSQLRLDDP
jgi:hypothetical protein